MRRFKLNTNDKIKKIFLLFVWIISSICNLQAQDQPKLRVQFNNELFNPILICLENNQSKQADVLLQQVEKGNLQNQSDTTRYLYNICKGFTLFQEDNYNNALKYFLTAKTIREESLGIVDSEYLELVRTIANCEKYVGNADRAVNYLQEIKAMGDFFSKFEIYGKILGDLTDLYIQKGQYADVEQLLKQAHEIVSKFRGDGDYESYQYQVELALFLSQKGEYEKSNQLIDEIISKLEKQDNEVNNQEYHIVLLLKGANYNKMKQYDKAQQYYTDAIKFNTDKFGKYDSFLSAKYAALLNLYCERNNEHEIDLLLPVMKDYFSHTGTELDFYGDIQNAAGILFSNVQNIEKAKKLYNTVLDSPVLNLAEKKYGKKSEEYGGLCNLLFVSAERTGRLDLAEQYLNTAFVVLIPIAGKDSPVYAILLHNKGKLLLDQKKYKEAVVSLTEAIELQKKISGNANPKTIEYLEEVKKFLK